MHGIITLLIFQKQSCHCSIALFAIFWPSKGPEVLQNPTESTFFCLLLLVAVYEAWNKYFESIGHPTDTFGNQHPFNQISDFVN